MFYGKFCYLIGLTVLFLTGMASHAAENGYREHCARCHQPDGEGLGFDVPQLIGSRVLNGPDEALIEFVLLGTEGRPDFITDFLIAMPSFQSLSDKDIAAILTYIRRSFGENGRGITEEAVGKVRGTCDN